MSPASGATLYPQFGAKGIHPHRSDLIKLLRAKPSTKPLRNIYRQLDAGDPPWLVGGLRDAGVITAAQSSRLAADGDAAANASTKPQRQAALAKFIQDTSGLPSAARTFLRTAASAP